MTHLYPHLSSLEVFDSLLGVVGQLLTAMVWAAFAGCPGRVLPLLQLLQARQRHGKHIRNPA